VAYGFDRQQTTARGYDDIAFWRELSTAADCYIEYWSILQITRMDTYEGYKQDLKLYAAKAATQPKPGDITA
jgi:hypothetical protein